MDTKEFIDILETIQRNADIMFDRYKEAVEVIAQLVSIITLGSADIPADAVVSKAYEIIEENVRR